jgi:hypothetical protein
MARNVSVSQISMGLVLGEGIKTTRWSGGERERAHDDAVLEIRISFPLRLLRWWTLALVGGLLITTSFPLS